MERGRTAGTGLVAVALRKTSRRLVFEVRLSGGGCCATPADDDPRRYGGDDQRQAADGQHYRLH